MHVLFLAPDPHAYNHGFLRGLKPLGARVSAIGMAGDSKLSTEARQLLDAYRGCDRLLDLESAVRVAKELAKPAFDRIETIDEPLVEVPPATYRSIESAGVIATRHTTIAINLGD